MRKSYIARSAGAVTREEVPSILVQGEQPHHEPALLVLQ